MMKQEDIGFSLRRFSELAKITENHFWFAGRQALVRQILAQHCQTRVERALDVGCGPGVWLSSWLHFAKDVCGIDPYASNIDPQILAPGTRVLTGLSSDLPCDDAGVDLVLTLDVLEHVDDGLALSEINRVLGPDGLTLITVPAYPWLWSYRDEDAGHLRRYTRKALEKKIVTAGFEVIHLQYYQGLLFPIVVLSRFLGKRNSKTRDAEDHPPEWINRIMRWINLFEVKARLRPVFGSSLLALARKTT